MLNHKSKKTQVNQKQLLTEFVIKHFNELYDVSTTKDFKRPNLSLEETRDIRAERVNKWNAIIKKLNSIGPPKNLVKWKKCYSDIARHIRHKNNNLNSFKLANPDCQIPAHLQLTENEIKVLELHGNPLKAHKNRYDYEEISVFNDPLNETKDFTNDEEDEDCNLNNDNSDENDNNIKPIKRKHLQIEETSNDIETNYEKFSTTIEENEIGGQIDVPKKYSNKKERNVWKHKLTESLELQKNSLRNLIDIRKELKNKKSCESCCESNKLILSMQKDTISIQKLILGEQRKSNILQTKNLEIQLKILKELKDHK